MLVKVSLICVIWLGLALAYPRPDQEAYTKKFDNVDIKPILNSDRLLGNYVNCLMDRGRCGPDAKELKRLLPDILEHGCSKCSELQKKKGEEVVDFLLDNRPTIWKELEAKFDPQGTYRIKYESEWNKHKEEKAKKDSQEKST